MPHVSTLKETPMRCFVSVISYCTSTYPNNLFGYVLWGNNRYRTVPYILVTSLEEYMQGTYRSVQGCLGMMYDDLLFVPAFALYANEAQARDALGRYAPLRIYEDIPPVAR